jgi:glycosyltransferase involved in cell wall biosynthesis
MIEAKPHVNIFRKLGTHSAKVTVSISLYNYADYIIETLDSVSNQTLELIDLIIVDDCSQDNSLNVTKSWLENNSLRFNHILFVKHQENQGLAFSRNTAITLSTTPYIFILDADNLLYPRCLIRCLETIENSDSEISMVYPIIEKFDGEIGIMDNQIWDRDILANGNYIDAMSLIRKTSLEAVLGYYPIKYGWEDYDLWCKFVEYNFSGVLVPEILARYRVHKQSMLRTETNQKINLVIKEMKKRHNWLKIKEFNVIEQILLN